jgi:hypothetical protein
MCTHAGTGLLLAGLRVLLLFLLTMAVARAAWFDPSWKYRVPVNVPAGAAINSTVKLDVDFAALLSTLGISGSFDVNSPRVVRPNNTLATIQEFTDSIYAGATDSVGNGRGEVRFILQDAGPATYYLYFDIVANGPKVANPQTPINGNFERGGTGTATPPGWANSTRSHVNMDIQIRPSETVTVTDVTTATTNGSPNTGQFSYLIGYRTNRDATNSNATLTRTFTIPASNPGSINIRIRPQGWDSSANGAISWDFLRVRLLNPATSGVLLDVVGPVLNNYITCPFSPNYGISGIGPTTPGYGRYNHWDNGTDSNNHTLGMSAAYDRGREPWVNCSASLAALAGQAVRLEIRIDTISAYRSWFLIDDVEWSVVTATLGTPEAAPSINHLRIEHSGNGVTCLRAPVTVKACADAACTQLYTAGPVTLSLTPSASWWTAATGGSQTDTLTISSGGQATRFLQRTAAGTVTLGATGVNPAPQNGVRCFVGATENCNLTFSDAGFIFSETAGGAAASIPTQVAGESSSTYYLRAVRTNTTTQACEAALSGTHTVEFAYECNNPASCFASNMMKVNGGTQTTIARNDNGSVSSYSNVSMTFNADGNAPFTFDYSDVGQVRLHVRKTGVGAPAATLTGASNSFVVKPWAFTVTDIKRASDGAANPEAADATGAAFMAAGGAFSATVSAISLSGGLTPSFGRESTPEGATLARSLVSPVGGAPGALDGTTTIPGASFQVGTKGKATVSDLSWSEVGIIKLKASNANYLGNNRGACTSQTAGEACQGTFGESRNIGRFYPAGFVLSNPVLTNACTSGTTPFTYFGQDGFTTVFELTAVNSLTPPQTTKNYAGDGSTTSWAKLPLTTWGAHPAGANNPGFGFAASGLPPGASLAASATAPSADNNNTWKDGTAKVTAKHRIVRPTNPAAPTTVEITALPVDRDNVTLAQAGTLGSTLQRFGRLRLINAYGSELLRPRVEYRAEYWDGNRWVVNADDKCSGIAANNVAIAAGGPAVHGTPTFDNGVGFITFNTAAAGGYDIALNLNAVGSNTSCNASHGGAAANKPWLQGHWSAPVNCRNAPAWAQDPGARIRLGSPRAPYIYLRERY